ncbi:hypothetical protein FDB50_15335 [Clostridium botulinum]|uniref:Uncharacterized protein n=1 Tax=Clostridium botulinum TaxID=1491 RepID=A0A846K4C7_CLOBO|nr:hypothetical protein [Clostridium botulinum]NFN36412.1 hypothetical protein [Clostridium botulinum]
MQMEEIKKLLTINKNWKEKFKGDLLDNLLEKCVDIEKYIDLITNEWMNIWISITKDKEIKNIYYDFNKQIKELDTRRLKIEYEVIYNIYKYLKDYDNESINNIEDIIEWINIIDVNSLEELENKLDEKIKYSL